ncbi:MbnP family protein [Flavobacterium psychrotolerans]|uniref:Copper-binding protein MbnP-like domain-containing protein n=1 Tax=Flavobacterium psychrotolerans TaxID=2169410 RepID=A0A2U1JLI9_9FLAO|nr:MbnP family protein [Flavobacterium psychrotolerans]PWA05865.1 hypothetical protein DB895_05435 [Flavobacterium psychrotolerans]
MIKKISICFIFSILFFQVTVAQKEKDSLIIDLHLKFGKQDLKLDEKYVSERKDTLQIEVFKFYLSNISIQYVDKSIYNQRDSYHLIDIENQNSLQIPINKMNKRAIEKISFTIGIDSLTSVSGALQGDLDPTKGMYWAWQSGYINMKIEGKSSSCNTRENEFQFHIGGYLKPHYSMRTVILEPRAITSNIAIDVDIATLFSELALSKTNSIMIPGKQAMEIADFSVKMFQIESK